MHTVIIGNGIAGITCARHLRKLSDEDITVISGETDHFFSRTALMYIYMGHMKYEHTKPYEDRFWEKNRISLKRAWVEAIDFERRKLHTDEGEVLSYDRLVIATGSKPRRGSWEGEDLNGVQGLYSLQDLERLEGRTKELMAAASTTSKRAVVVGGGLIGIELCEMFLSRGLAVTMLVREPHFWSKVLSVAEGRLVERHMRSHGVELLVDTELKSLIGDESDTVTHVELNNGNVVACDAVGVSIGVEPNVAWLKGSNLELSKGILVDRSFHTNMDGVYAIGDCAEFRDPPDGVASLNQVWYTGRMMGETLGQILSGKQLEYSPGPWFNSAKFFDLEFQSYGLMSVEEDASNTVFFWQDKVGLRSVKVVFDSLSNKLLGINTIGVRVYHEKIAPFISEGCHVKHVLENARTWLFDPEFASDLLPELIHKWNATHPEIPVQVERKKRWFEIR